MPHTDRVFTSDRNGDTAQECVNKDMIKLLNGIVKRADPCKCDVRLVSRILWDKRMTPSIK